MRPVRDGAGEQALERVRHARARERVPRERRGGGGRRPAVVVHRTRYRPATLDAIEAITPLAVLNCSVSGAMPCRRAIQAKSV